jgi:leader peptidase (prepilin peptidase)/N-methyltransferase
MIASVTGTLLGVTALLLSGKGLRRRIPFGPFLSMGALAYCFFGHPLKDWYLGLFT